MLTYMIKVIDRNLKCILLSVRLLLDHVIDFLYVQFNSILHTYIKTVSTQKDHVELIILYIYISQRNIISDS